MINLLKDLYGIIITVLHCAVYGSKLVTKFLEKIVKETEKFINLLD